MFSLYQYASLLKRLDLAPTTIITQPINRKQLESSSGTSLIVVTKIENPSAYEEYKKLAKPID